MNEYDRETMIGWGQAVAAYAAFRENDTVAGGVFDNAILQGAIEGAHTRWAVTSNTGDNRLGRVAGRSAAGRTLGMNLAVFGIPFALFMGVVALSFAVPMPGAVGPILLVGSFALAIYLARMTGHTSYRNQYTRANLPSERELNRSGYWQVEPDTWFNPITQRVLYGHAYSGVEARDDRAAYRDESQQIRNLYRDMKGHGSQPAGDLSALRLGADAARRHGVPGAGQYGTPENPWW